MVRVRIVLVAAVLIAGRRRGAGAIARTRRPGAGARDLAGRQDRDLRQLRHLRDPLVAGEGRRIRGAAFPRWRGQRGGAAARRPRRHRAARTPASRSGSPARRSRSPCSKATRRRSSRSRFRRMARRSASASWDHTARLWPLAGGERARARRPQGQCERRCVHARRQVGRHRRLRRDAAHLAARRRRARGRHAADAAQHRRDRARRRDRRRRRRWQGLFPDRQTASSGARSRSARCRSSP